jgi:hypothetical protein
MAYHRFWPVWLAFVFIFFDSCRSIVVLENFYNKNTSKRVVKILSKKPRNAAISIDTAITRRVYLMVCFLVGQFTYFNSVFAPLRYLAILENTIFDLLLYIIFKNAPKGTLVMSITNEPGLSQPPNRAAKLKFSG